MATADYDPVMMTAGVAAPEYERPRESEGVFVSDFRVARGSVNVHGAEVHYKGYFPEDRSEEGLGVMVPGFGGFYKSSEPLGKALAQAGMANVIYDPARRHDGPIVEDLTDPQQLHVDTIEAISNDVIRNPWITRQMPEGKQAAEERRLLIAHSMGGLAAGRYASQNPEQVDSVYFLKACGFGGPNLGQLAKSVPRGIIGSVRHELIPYLTSGEIETSWSNVRRVLNYFGLGTNSRITRPVGEALSCIRDDIRPIVAGLGRLGVKTVYVDAERDILVHPAPGIHDVVDYYYLLEKYGHMAPQLRSRMIAGIILDTRRAMAGQASKAST